MVFKVADNVLQLCVRWRLEHKTFKQAQKMNRNTELENMHCTATDAKLLLAAGADLKRYSTIVVDPPWAYGIWGSGSAKALVQGDANKPAPLPYNSMAVEEIKALPLKRLANENCELYLWTTQKYLPDAFDVIKSWGFKYCQTLTWCKKPMGKGQGGVYCPTTEFLILARRGKMPKVERIDTTWWEVKRQMKHSKKPEFFQDLIEQVSEAPRLEMFARREREGWDVFGNEVNNSIDLERYRSTCS